MVQEIKFILAFGTKHVSQDGKPLLAKIIMCMVLGMLLIFQLELSCEAAGRIPLFSNVVLVDLSTW